jgi:hypothetical protein
VSRNAPLSATSRPRRCHLKWLGVALLLCGFDAATMVWAQSFAVDPATNPASQVVIVENQRATTAFQARPDIVAEMLRRGITHMTGEANTRDAWLSLISTQDVVGLKIYSRPGPNSGTRPAVVRALAQSLLAAGVPARQIIIWDRDEKDLRDAGFFQLGEELGVRVAAAVSAGWDAEHFYDTPLIGNLVYGDLEFERKSDGVGRKSHVSRLLTDSLTKIINVTPLLNHNQAGVCGNLYSLAMGSTDNIQRFVGDYSRLAVAVPELYALPELGDRVVLNITDALLCQYEGGQRGLLHYSVMLNQLRFSRDPVALDALSLKELDAQRRKTKAPNLRPNVELYRNATLLELGVSDPTLIRIETLR